MPYMLIRHKVKDYTKWKTVFDAHNAFANLAAKRHTRFSIPPLIPKTLCSSLNGIIWRTLGSL